jgi:hypothetical protein
VAQASSSPPAKGSAANFVVCKSANLLFYESCCLGGEPAMDAFRVRAVPGAGGGDGSSSGRNRLAGCLVKIPLSNCL